MTVDPSRPLRMADVFPELEVPPTAEARDRIERDRRVMEERCGTDLADRWAGAMLDNPELRFIFGVG